MESFRKLLEKLEFREIPAPYKDDSEERVYGLFKSDGTKIGESTFTSSRFGIKAWYLRDIYILPEFKRRGYGSKLLVVYHSDFDRLDKDLRESIFERINQETELNHGS
jgi:GNAT superfamily N-acetyltransferase